jgi:4'-phosphopantetheinyl transferase
MLIVAAACTDDVLSEAGSDPNGLPASFGRAERERWDMLPPSARASFVASRLLLRRLLARASGVPEAEWTVSATAGRAPVAARSGEVPGSDGARTPGVSLSHRLGWVCAATGPGEIGVDIEVDRPARTESSDRAALILAAVELAAWHALAPDERDASLLACWTAKEAWFKSRPPGHAPWDFRSVVARACDPSRANVRVWRAPPLHVAVCCGQALELANAACCGLDVATAKSSFWHVATA